jgi:hypothetical protein
MSLHSTPRVLVSSNSAATTGTDLSNLLTGEVAFLKPDGTFLAAGETIADAATIQPVLGRTGKAPKFGAVIQGKNIKKFEGHTYAAAAQQVSYIGSNGTAGSISPLLAGTSTAPVTYSLHIDFLHDKELYSERQHRRSYSKAYTTTPTQDQIAVDFVAMINADVEAAKYVVAAKTTENANRGISLTGVAQTYNVLNGYELVSFKVFADLGFTSATRVDELGYVYVDGAAGTTSGATSVTPKPGSGTYALVADLEEYSIGYDGALNRTKFPIPAAEKFAVVGTNYDVYAIEFEDVHSSSSLNRTLASPETLILAVYTNSANQTALEAILNPYLASCPGNFAALNL